MRWARIAVCLHAPAATPLWGLLGVGGATLPCGGVARKSKASNRLCCLGETVAAVPQRHTEPPAGPRSPVLCITCVGPGAPAPCRWQGCADPGRDPRPATPSDPGLAPESPGSRHVTPPGLTRRPPIRFNLLLKSLSEQRLPHAPPLPGVTSLRRDPGGWRE